MGPSPVLRIVTCHRIKTKNKTKQIFMISSSHFTRNRNSFFSSVNGNVLDEFRNVQILIPCCYLCSNSSSTQLLFKVKPTTVYIGNVAFCLYFSKFLEGLLCFPFFGLSVTNKLFVLSSFFDTNILFEVPHFS